MAKGPSVRVRFFAVLIVSACLWGHVSEVFDTWDHSFQTGNDIEYSVALFALVTGAVLALAHFSPAVMHTTASVHVSPAVRASGEPVQPFSTPRYGHSPPLELRV